MNNITKKMVAVDKEQAGFLLSVVLSDIIQHKEEGIVTKVFSSSNQMRDTLVALGEVDYDHLSREEQDEKVAGVLRQLIYAFDSNLLTK